jgi:hypothetical protein
MFAAETIQGTGKLACPRCGTVFQFRPATTPAQPTTPTQVPIAQPVRPAPTPPPVPTATPVIPARVPPPLPNRPTNPAAATAIVPSVPVLDITDEEEEEEDRRRQPAPDPRLAFDEPASDDEESGALVRRRRGKQPSWAKWLWMGPLLLTFTSTTIVLSWLYIRTLRHPDMAGEEAYVNGLENAYYPLPSHPWNRTKDDEARARQVRGAMKVNYVAYRSDPATAFALFNRDYENRLPSEGEVVDVALQKLRAYFTSLEWEKKEEPATWGEKKALRIEFQGVDGDNVLSTGEVWSITHRGVAYWYFCWCPESLHDAVAPDWETLRGKFTLGAKREGWKETPPKSETVRVPDTRYQISYPDKMWEHRLEEGWDPAAKVVLIAFERDGKREPLKDPRLRHTSKMAVCQVLRLPKAENLTAAVDATKMYVLEQQKKDLENAVFQPVEEKKGRKAEGPADIGGLKGYVLRLELLPDTGAKKRLFLLAVVSDADGVLAMVFEANAERREYWEAEFAPVWQSLRSVK